jgi:hypothetical protein
MILPRILGTTDPCITKNSRKDDGWSLTITRYSFSKTLREYAGST